ncbi:glycoside hydrolase family 10 protein [Longimicrobium sp.]|uniref:glycoside hydrolase family 10 protein n=1 Tax=Longimicrobium sp. TaxID=2029185 RepID=UPI002B74168C|nr:family 10 glycosylhydrolase [Longimicrobium sp.]HSU15331.1 family 10 glycosylhydrolase [Longimicrobium sp.]
MISTRSIGLLAAVPALLLGAAGARPGIRHAAAPADARIPALASAFAARPAAAAPKHREPPEEARALWVNRWDYGSAETIAQVMEIASRAHFNIVYFQVRGPSDARYRSELDPCSARLCGRLGGQPGWDPLEVAVREAHARGLQLHAWLNALSGWDSQSGSLCRGLTPSLPGNPDHELIAHPEWAMRTRRGAPQACPNDEEYVFLSPGYAGVRTHLARVAADVVRRYAVDGVHLDRIRYPGPEFGWDSASLAEFGRDPSADPAGWSRFRRELVDRTVREVHDSIRAVRPVPLSAAVWPIYDRARFGWPSSSGSADFFQDTWTWARDGYLDVAVPMTYFYVADQPCTYLRRRPGAEPNPDWMCMVRDHVAGMRPTGRHVYAGILAGLGYAEVEKQIRIGRELGVNGFSFYFYSTVAESGLWRRLGEGPFREPARVPRMDWLTPQI